MHLDNISGDRTSPCKALMMPIQLTYKSKKGRQVMHICLNAAFKKYAVLQLTQNNLTAIKVLFC
ncbi:MAG: RNHCP domain-containing protein [Alphaproteobacteria bacterium]|nr:RNHCP domain-containing protein [Alphaproteobacteria bacterium]